MTDVTIHDLLKLIRVERDSDGNLLVIDVRGNVYGCVRGDVYGDVMGDVYGDVWGEVHGEVEGNEALVREFKRSVQQEKGVVEEQ